MTCYVILCYAVLYNAWAFVARHTSGSSDTIIYRFVVSCYRTLIKPYYTVLHTIILHYITLYYIILYYIILYYIILYYTTLCYVILYYIILYYIIV